jgi:hypothetical protein
VKSLHTVVMGASVHCDEGCARFGRLPPKGG